VTDMGNALRIGDTVLWRGGGRVGIFGRGWLVLKHV
jgi:hypothetical protein